MMCGVCVFSICMYVHAYLCLTCEVAGVHTVSNSTIGRSIANVHINPEVNITLRPTST